MARELAVIGKPLPKVDAPGKVTGQTRYADDLALPRMLYGRILRSSEVHALIKSVDAGEALKLPGVHAVITGKDLSVPFGAIALNQDETALAQDRVRYIGEPIAAVAAIDEET
ncbi:MAG TPA: aldehyde oxidase, partial [Dehalococcoidia bacterium]|nr:aldehyde oxidase [Dehalococcoidia bacterium]